MSGNYPYSRSDECSWQPEEAARRLGSLLSSRESSAYFVRGAGGGGGVVAGGGGGGGHRRRRDYDPLPAAAAAADDDDRADRSVAPRPPEGEGGRPPTHLLTRGRSSAEVRALRGAYGSNTLHGDLGGENDDDTDIDDGPSHLRKNASKCMGVAVALLRAFYDQLKEPLILMLLFSAGISLCLGNAADAVSIGMALGIVSMVAAIQEYRSEKGELCLRGESMGGVLWCCFVVMLYTARGRRGVRCVCVCVFLQGGEDGDGEEVVFVFCAVFSPRVNSLTSSVSSCRPRPHRR